MINIGQDLHFLLKHVKILPRGIDIGNEPQRMGTVKLCGKRASVEKVLSKLEQAKGGKCCDV